MSQPDSELAAKIAALPPEKRALLLEKLRQRREAAREQIQPQPRKGQPFPLSFEQERMWFIHQWDPHSPLYNDRLTLHLSGTVDPPMLEAALNAVVQRQESLRTIFRLVDLQPVQVIAPELKVAVPLVDLQHLPEAARVEELHRRAREEIRAPFDLEHGPLLRSCLLRLSPTEAVLLVTMHHIVFDGWSFGILIRDLLACYAELQTGQPGALPELAVQYADFAVWERQWLQEDVLASLLQYWKRQLAGSPDVLPLPTDRPRPAVQTSYGARIPIKLTPELCEALKALARQNGVTFFVTLLAAFGVLLHRLTGEMDIVVGVPIANRHHAATTDLIGVFMNTLAVRLDLSGNPTFEQLLQRIHQVTLDGQSHQQLPFARLVAELQPERSLSHTPLFQVSFGFQDAPMQAALNLPGVTADVYEMRALRATGDLPPLDNGMAMFELTFHLLEAAEGVAGWVEYKTDLFERATLSRWITYYQTLLQSALAAPAAPIAALPMLSSTELQQVLHSWNATQAPYPDAHCIHTLFEGVAAQTPEAIALTFEQQTLTYAELNRRANQLAHYLRALGVGPEVLVGICVPRSLDMIIAILGVFKAGGAYLPLDPHYPQDRLAYMLADAQPLVVLTQQSLRDALPECSARISCLDINAPAIAACASDNPSVQITPEQLAYVIYTSGSTGKPKGTLLTHRGLCKVAAAQRDVLQVSAPARIVQFSSLNFDASLFDIVMAWGSGATLCLGSAEALLPGPPLLEFLRTQAITHITIPPSALAAVPVVALPDLHTIAVAGEACPADLVARWAEGRRFFNLYGPTETTIWATAIACTDSGSAPPIGRPIPNTTIYVVDANLQSVPVGIAGELLIGGVGLARGYLNRPALTAERFIPDPFSGKPGARLYRTGDRARWLPNGNLEFLGRLDDQVKVRGFRIELGEIEAVLSQHPGVREVVVMLREDTGRPQLVAYCVAEGQPPSSELRDFCKELLPDYMLPAVFVLLEQLPLSPNGKVDRRALPSPEQGRLSSRASYVAPRTPAETALAHIWAQLLRVEQVGIHDNFFELGGDSIQSVQIAAAAAQAGLRLTSRQIFEHQTIAELAQVAGALGALSTDQGPVTGSAPLTPVQIWFFAGAPVAPHHWNQAVLLETPPALEMAWLEQATRAVLVHHDALRLRFQPGSQGWTQAFAPPDDFAPVKVISLAGLSPDVQREALSAHAAAAQGALVLESGPLVQVAYFDLGADRAGRLLVVAHHLVVDGVSWPILLQDLLAAYQQLAAGEAPALPPKTTSYQQWAQRLEVYAAQSAELADELPYWNQIAQQPSVPLPVDFAAGEQANTEGSVAIARAILPIADTAMLLHSGPAPESWRAQDVLLAALALTLGEWTSSEPVRVELESHGRELLFADVDVSRTVGWFTSLYPIVLSNPPGADSVTLLNQIQAQLRAVPRQGIGYGLLRYLYPDSTATAMLRSMPPAQLVFNYLGQLVGGAWPLATEPYGPLRSPNARRRHLLEVNAQVVEGQLHLDWHYSQAIHRQATMQQLADRYMAHLKTLLADCRAQQQEAWHDTQHN